ncbi:ferritin-like domain-containing protein [Christiangramia sp. SM2212]|uniref:Ferritin-like domain-containing protein n=1 Tax=Christiangramia sediminicola TaxID=3073267 RepID=A0ABU1EQM6_9FLAO|nr:ferritin-like domain-containing protein [Christiangramia sp. SM2212]MDR5590699.1 ferritin-like domain-containing protein [Christiangramia sp. SM2212]
MEKPVIKVEAQKANGKSSSRRSFLKLGGLAVVGSSLMLYSCEPDEDEIFSADAKAKGVNNKKVFNLGEGDRAILNYAYILEQLEAAFYAEVVNGESLSFSGMEGDYEIFYDIYQHELIHRDFFELVLDSLFDPGEVAPNLEFDFSAVDFSDRDTVLNFAQILEDTGVQAYNGAGKLLSNATYLLLAGKIVSVEARHASAIRDLIGTANGDLDNFADEDVTVGLSLGDQMFPEAFDDAVDPNVILERVAGTGFLQTRIIANNIPTE